MNGAVAALALEVAGLIVNKNAVPNDRMPPFYPSGIRLGTPATTTRGLKEKEMIKIAKWMNETIDEVSNYSFPSDKEKRKEFWKKFKQEILENKKLLSIGKEVKKLCLRFPLF